ncbi:MAG: hypothetical protein HZC42_09445 [Candidatus Eisenbacteria bacterium]|nr:hypothetical protein [Candidatus Eisenbacteria bacterium]
MKRKVLLLLFALSVAVTAPVFAQTDVFLLGFTGFDYEDPNLDTGNYLQVGDGYKALGFVTSFGPYLQPYVDTGVNEYTFYFYDLTVATRFFAGGVLEVTFDNNGRGRYFEDSRTSGSPGTYGTNPPNATAPSTFTDGTLALGGQIDNFALVYDFNLDQGNFQGNMTLDEGVDLIYIPSGQRAGWTLGGLAGRPNATVPQGYDNQISGECRIPGPTPTTHATWGALKALYR